jgi:hypothetical protein
MLCDKYKEALIEAVASGAALPSGLREHVEVCASCSARLTAERTLFAAIDGGLHKAANAKVRSSFLLNVKANLASETVPTGNPMLGWAFVCAAGALALAAAFLVVPRGAHDKARTEAVIVPNKVPAGVAELSLVPERKTRHSVSAFTAAGQRDGAGTTSHEPEVLIQPEEEESLKRLYAAMHNPERYARAVVTDDHEVTPKLLVIEQIEVGDLKIDNLEEEVGLAQTSSK